MALSDLLADVYGASLGEFIVEKRKRRHRTDGEILQYGTGVAVRLQASTYGLSRYFRSTWIGGVVDVVPGLIVWHGGYFRKSGGTPISASDFKPLHLRSVSGRETWSVTKDHVILVGDFDGRRVELALLIEEMALVLDSLGAKDLLD